MALRLSDHATEIKAKIKNDLLLMKSSKSWYLLDKSENQEIALYSRKEMAAILHTSIFVEITEKLISAAIFRKEHYFCLKDENSYKEFWTESGLAFLKNILVISKQEEDDYIAHHYFVEDSLGIDQMVSAIALRYNEIFLEEDEETKKESTVRNFITGSWGSFQLKNKEDFDKYLTILYGLRRDIEQKKTIYGRSKENDEKIVLPLIDDTIEFEEIMP